MLGLGLVDVEETTGQQKEMQKSESGREREDDGMDRYLLRGKVG